MADPKPDDATETTKDDTPTTNAPAEEEKPDTSGADNVVRNAMLRAFEQAKTAAEGAGPDTDPELMQSFVDAADAAIEAVSEKAPAEGA